MIAIDLSKRQALDAKPKALQQINVTGNLGPDENTTMFFITKEAKETISNFSEETVRTLWKSLYDVAAACSKLYQYTVAQYNTANVKLYSSQLNKLKSDIRNGTQLILNLLSNVVSDFNDETNFHHKLLLTNTQVSWLPSDDSIVNIK